MVYYNQLYLVLIGIVAFIVQLRLLHILRYHKTIALFGTTLSNARKDFLSFGCVMAVIFIAFTGAIYLMYHDLAVYSTMATAMGSQVFFRSKYKILPFR